MLKAIFYTLKNLLTPKMKETVNGKYLQHNRAMRKIAKNKAEINEL